MAKLTFTEAKEKGYRNLAELMAILVSGKNPDGTDFSLPTAGSTAPREAEIAYASGKMYSVGTGRQTLAAAGNVRAILQNPGGSGTLVKVVMISYWSSITAFWDTFRDPTAGVPVTAARPRLTLDQRADAAAKVGILRSDSSATTALGGGTDLGMTIPNGAGRENEVKLDVPLVISPGQSFGFNGNFTGATDAVVNMIAYEVAA